MLMAKTSAERQAAYRKNRDNSGTDGNGERRINLWVSTRAYMALTRLANRYGVTKQAMLERLIIEEDDRVLKEIGDDDEKWKLYFFKQNVTP
jgi:hypothetical protein